MSDNKSVVRRYVEEIWNQGRADAIDEVCAGFRQDEFRTSAP